MQEAARVAFRSWLPERLGQRHRARADRAFELLLDADGDRRRIAEPHGGVEAGDEVGQITHK